MADMAADNLGIESQQKVKRLKLGAKMEVLEVATDAKGELVVKMLWNYPKKSIVNKHTTIKYSQISKFEAKDAIFNQLGCPVYVEGNGAQKAGFHQFLEQEIEKFEDTEEEGQEPGKIYLEFKECSVHKAGSKYFLICGEGLTFVLNDGDLYSRQLSTEEIDALDFGICWNGPKVKVKYESNDKEAVKVILKILSNINMLQDEEFYGFVLASIVSHLRGFLYVEILGVQRCFYTTIVVSGVQRGTGKSLMFAIMQNLLYGCQITAEKHISDSMMYQKLAGKTGRGRVPVYVNEWDGNSKLFNNSVMGIWEGSAWSTKLGEYIPKTVLLCNANSTPDAIKFEAGVKSKCSVIFTGPNRLHHDNKLEITEETVADALDGHIYLPSIVGLAIKTLIDKVTSAEVRKYNADMEDLDDEREGQVLRDYNHLYEELSTAGAKYDVNLPPVLEAEPNHTCFTYFHDKQGGDAHDAEDTEKKRKDAAAKFINNLIKMDKISILSPMKMKDIAGFKIESSVTLPSGIQSDLWTCSETFVRSVQGNKFRCRFIPASRISTNQQELIEEYLTSFKHLYAKTLTDQADRVSIFGKKYLDTINKSSTSFDREIEDIQRAVLDSIDDEIETDTIDDEMRCGVATCPLKDKVWFDEARREKHRNSRQHLKAIKAGAVKNLVN